MGHLSTHQARHLLLTTTREPGLKSLLDEIGEIARRPVRPVRCGICLAPITSHEERIAVDGRNFFRFTNPQGITFDILCFRSALGCHHNGKATDHFSWFEGYAWQFVHCGDCDTHLGWYYRSCHGDDFYGLIATLLIEP